MHNCKILSDMPKAADKMRRFWQNINFLIFPFMEK